MDASLFEKAQAIVMEHAFTIGIVLLVAVLLAGFVWFSMSQTTKSPVLENQVRVNEATTAPPQQELPTQEQLEEMSKYAEKMEAQQTDSSE
jgi:hypothetical protein